MAISPQSPAVKLADSTTNVKNICVTGGPAGGKTTIMPDISELALAKGWRPIVIPEAATIVLTALRGGSAKVVPASVEVQTAIARVQRNLAESLISGLEGEEERLLVVHDRGPLDALAYRSRESLEQIFQNVFGMAIDELALEYDAVLHLQSTAVDAPQHYSLENNAARTETVEQASIADLKTQEVWAVHPHQFIVTNGGAGWIEKRAAALRVVSDLLDYWSAVR